MKLLHTSDWHLGRSLYGHKRDVHYDAFLSWLLCFLETHAVDILIIAGDVFDSATPSPKTQEQYYSFLHRVSQTPCRHVVVVAGNHDCPQLLDAPKTLLYSLSVHVIGMPPEDPTQCVLTLNNQQGQAQAIVCAVPYLRERDVRRAEADENFQDKGEKWLQGMHNYYERAATYARQLALTHQEPLPLIATGHLFATGGQTLEYDGVRTISVGGIDRVPLTVFSSYFDYVALGHLHLPQTLCTQPLIHYCGSPLAMGFGEAQQQKSVSLVCFSPTQQPAHQRYPVPVFQTLHTLQGTTEQVLEQCAGCVRQNQSVWLQVIIEQDNPVPVGFLDQLDACTKNSPVQIVRIARQRLETAKFLDSAHADALPLQHISPLHVFHTLLDQQAVPPQRREGLIACYQEILHSDQLSGFADKGLDK